jgi:tetratricopeptide (TPR) repeat protein
MARPVTPKIAALIEQGMQLARSGGFQEAARVFERVLQQMPELAEVHAMHADALMRGDRLEPALGAVQRALRLRPGWGEALMLRGNIEALLDRFAAAEASFRAAMRVLGPTPALHANLGNVLFEQERFADALAMYASALRGNDSPELLARRARTLYALGERERAALDWQAILEREPASLEALEQLMQIRMGQRAAQELEAVCRRAIELAPQGAAFHIGLGLSLWWHGRHDEALAAYGQAARLAEGRDEEIAHQASLHHAVALLKLGRLEEGWRRYLARLDRGALRDRYPHLAPDPSAIAASHAALRLRVHTEQGIGDELFFLRFAPALRARGHRLSLRTQSKLQPLLAAQAEPFDRVGLESEADPSPCDAELLVSDLALASGAWFAPPLPLSPDARRLEAARARLSAFGPAPYVGVTWRAGLLAEEQKQWGGLFWAKHVPAQDLGRMLSALRATVVILQRKPDAAEMAHFASGLGRAALDASEVNEDLQEALAVLSLLDEYVGVSNTNMHLLAGLPAGRARVFVQMLPEWRWGMSGDASPWFPGFKLYRQAWDGSWKQAFGDLESDLRTSLKQ